MQIKSERKYTITLTKEELENIRVAIRCYVNNAHYNGTVRKSMSKMLEIINGGI